MIHVPHSYSREYLETNKCRPFFDKAHEILIESVSKQQFPQIDETFSIAGFLSTEDIFNRFRGACNAHFAGSKLNKITGLEKSVKNDIIIGCTHYLDDLHLKSKDIQVLEKEYSYHYRMNPHTIVTTIEDLRPGIPLIISVPLSNLGGMHPRMNEIYDICLERDIPVHIDAAWVSACKNIEIDFAHPAIHSMGFSLSKGYGLSGWNRVGLRYTKHAEEDSVSLMNDHLQIPSAIVNIGNYFLDNVSPDHLWNKHGDNHYKICQDFNLTPTDTIHMAKDGDKIIGIAPLLRYLENKDTD
jgi:hypothetical protein